MNVAYSLLRGEQRKNLLNTQQLFEHYKEARQRCDAYAGSMSYSTISGREYLYKTTSFRGKKVRKSIGPRSAETDQLLARWNSEKIKFQERLSSLQQSLEKQSKLNIAHDIARIPQNVAAVLRKLSTVKAQAGQGGGCLVLGTNSLYAYEAQFGVEISGDLLATRDLDILVDSRRKLVLCSDRPEVTLITLLKEIDETYEKSDVRPYCVVNSAGFEIEFIKSIENPPWKKPAHPLNVNDVELAEIHQMRWVLNAPKIAKVAVDENGYPVDISAVHPLAFSVYKEWMSKEPSRDPVKRVRDTEQAQVVFNMIMTLAPDQCQDIDAISWLPEEAVSVAKETLVRIKEAKSPEVSPGFPY